MMVAIQAGETDAELNEKDAEIRELRQKVADWNVLERRRPSNVQESAFCDYSRPVGSFGTQLNLPVQAHVFSEEELVETKR